MNWKKKENCKIMKKRIEGRKEGGEGGKEEEINAGVDREKAGQFIVCITVSCYSCNIW